MYPYLIIEWEQVESGEGPLGLGPRFGTDGLGNTRTMVCLRPQDVRFIGEYVLIMWEKPSNTSSKGRTHTLS